MKHRAILLAFASAACAARAAAQMPAFTFERAVTADSAGWHRLALDATVLAGGAPFRVTPSTAVPGAFVAVGGLNDLRLYDGDAREVPYLLVYAPARPQPRFTARPLAITPGKHTSGFEADLGAVRLVDALAVSGLPAPFMKRARLEGSGDRAHWTMLVAEGTLFDLPQQGMKQVELEFTPGDYRYLRVTWDDSSSARMPLPMAVSVRSAATRTPPPPPLVVPVTITRRASEPGMSRYAITLPGAHLPIVALRLTVGDSNVLRSAKVTEARLIGMDVSPAPLGAATLRRAVRGGLVASQLDVAIMAPREDRVELTIDDANNPPLTITGAQAVFAELPYVFFQTPAAAAPLTARYGAPSLPAPRYDLEALRDSAAALAFTPAQWGAVTRLQPAAAAGADAGVAIVGAPLDVTAFRWSRTIADTTPGLATLRLDAAALAHSHLVDLRIADAQGRQVPYLFERLGGPLTDTLPPLVRIAPADAAGAPRNVTRYRLHLPFDSLRDARLVLRTSSRVFQRRVRVEVPAPEERGRRAGIRAVADAQWAHAEPDTPAPALVLPLPPLARDSAAVVIDEGDNTPLPLDAPLLLLPGYQLRFLGDGQDGLALLYGNRDASAPRYDIALLGPRLVGVPATEVTMGPEGPAREIPTNAIPGRVFWGVLIAAVLVLLVIVARLVKGGPEGT